MALDDQATKALMQTLQQAVQILQGGMGGDSAMGDNDDDSDDDIDPSLSDDTDPGDDGDGADGDMSGNLHDRISKLESHTGLKKSADDTPLLTRLDALESTILGEEYEGPANLRVQQLEKALGSTQAVTTQVTPTQATTQEDDAPDVIQLDQLMKAAAAEGARQAIAQFNAAQATSNDNNQRRTLPNIQTMRKNAATDQVQYNTRRAQAPGVQTDEDLTKAAQAWGMDGGDLDQPLGFGDTLQILYDLQRQGSVGIAQAEAEE